MTMPRQLISSGSPFERDIAYSRAVAQGDWVFVSGTTGFDYATMTIAEDIESQAEQCLKNIESALTQAGLCGAGRQPVRALLAGAAPLPGRGAPGQHDDFGAAAGYAHEDRDGSDGAEAAGCLMSEPLCKAM
jgi:Endoribonuclease L-PSP